MSEKSKDIISENFYGKVKDFLHTYDRSNPNHKILKIAKKQGFKEAHKVVGLVARKIQRATKIKSLEGITIGKKGDWHCIGAGGEHWVQSENSLLSKYDHSGEHVTIKGKKWHRFEPKPNQPPVIASQIPHEFEVESSYGRLKGKAGDYLLMKSQDKYNRNPKNVWLVDKKIFHSTYKFKEE